MTIEEDLARLFKEIVALDDDAKTKSEKIGKIDELHEVEESVISEIVECTAVIRNKNGKISSFISKINQNNQSSGITFKEKNIGMFYLGKLYQDILKNRTQAYKCFDSIHRTIKGSGFPCAQYPNTITESDYQYSRWAHERQGNLLMNDACFMAIFPNMPNISEIDENLRREKVLVHKLCAGFGRQDLFKWIQTFILEDRCVMQQKDTINHVINQILEDIKGIDFTKVYIGTDVDHTISLFNIIRKIISAVSALKNQEEKSTSTDDLLIGNITPGWHSFQSLTSTQEAEQPVLSSSSTIEPAISNTTQQQSRSSSSTAYGGFRRAQFATP